MKSPVICNDEGWSGLLEIIRWVRLMSGFVYHDFGHWCNLAIDY